MLANMRLSTKVLTGYAAILSTMTALTVYGIAEVRSIDNSLATINDLNSVKQRYAINFRGSAHESRSHLVPIDSLKERVMNQ